MEIATFAIAGFQYSALRFMNFDGLATELTGLHDTWIEVGTAGRTSINAVLHEITIAMSV